MPLLIDYGAITAFVIVFLGVVLQIKKVLVRKSAEDIHLGEVLLRMLAVSLLLLKLIQTGDIILIVGHSSFTALMVVYVGVLIRFRLLQRERGGERG